MNLHSPKPVEYKKSLGLVLLLMFLLSSNTVTLGAPDGPIFEYLPPINKDNNMEFDFDGSLLEYLTVKVVLVDNPSASITFDNNEKGAARLRGSKSHYLVNWVPEYRYKEYRVQVYMLDMLLGTVELTPNMVLEREENTIPIKFRVENNPGIRARIYAVLGYSPKEFISELINEFGLDTITVSELMVSNGYTPTEIAEGLMESNSETHEKTAEILNTLGFQLPEIVTALHDGFDLEPRQVIADLYDIYDLVSISETIIPEYMLDMNGLSRELVQGLFIVDPESSLNLVSETTIMTLIQVYDLTIGDLNMISAAMAPALYNPPSVQAFALEVEGGDLDEVAEAILYGLVEGFDLTTADSDILAEGLVYGLKEGLALDESRLGDIVEATIKAFVRVFGYTIENITPVVKSVVKAVKRVFGYGWDKIKLIAAAVAKALKKIFGLVREQMGTITPIIIEALVDAFGSAASLLRLLRR